MINGIDTVREYLEWVEQPADKSVEAFAEHLEDVENAQTVESVTRILDQVQSLSESWTDTDQTDALLKRLDKYEAAVRSALGVLEGGYDYQDISTLSGESKRVRVL